MLEHYGADIKFRDSYGHTAFHLACENGHLEVLKFLHGKDKDYKETSEYMFGPSKKDFSSDNNFFNIRNKYGKNALMVATEFRRLNCVEWILAQYKDVEYVNKTRGKANSNTAIFYACVPDPNIDPKDKNGTNDPSFQILELLIQNGANVDVISEEKNRSKDKPSDKPSDDNFLNEKLGQEDTPLIWAATYGAVQHCKLIIDTLMKKYTDDKDLELHLNVPFSGTSNTKSRWSIVGANTALMMAAERGHVEIVELMLENPRIKNLLNFNCCAKFEDVKGKPKTSKKTAIYLALINGHFRTAAKLTHRQEFDGSFYDLKIDNCPFFFNDNDIDELVMNLSNVELNSKKWYDLAKLAAMYPFYFHIFRGLIRRSESVSRILGICGRPFLQNLDHIEVIDLIERLIQFLCCLKNASDSKPWEVINVYFYHLY